ncbi:hypothetical protein DM02DRAFT_126758 [Periconia macrospinosa]|uniref:Uncharacterized protein n=1 Tax=Periconia macrospinosa TaxID=97972 RepID=A0A2V1E749_9PLEO|nr:hypothetical protein DM02DRAFT_126758 [Periconia macrospinosa]
MICRNVPCYNLRGGHLRVSFPTFSITFLCSFGIHFIQPLTTVRVGCQSLQHQMLNYALPGHMLPTEPTFRTRDPFWESKAHAQPFALLHPCMQTPRAFIETTAQCQTRVTTGYSKACASWFIAAD